MYLGQYISTNYYLYYIFKVYPDRAKAKNMLLLLSLLLLPGVG